MVTILSKQNAPRITVSAEKAHLYI